MRIASLLPSATEIVFALGLGDSVVGVSHECDFPPDAATKTRLIEPVFDTQQLSSDQIDRLVIKAIQNRENIYRIKMDEFKLANPDIVITQELCDVCAIGAEDVLGAVNKLGKSVKVISLDPHTLSDVKDDVRRLGNVLGTPKEAERLANQLEWKAERVRDLTKDSPIRRVVCLEWLKPIMNAGHWVPEIVEHAGGVEGLANRGKPSTYIEWDDVLAYDPDVLVLMPCGFTTERTLREMPKILELEGISKLTAVKRGEVFATDGHNYFSRSGPRIFDAIKILARMIHPELFPEPLHPALGRRVEILNVRN